MSNPPKSVGADFTIDAIFLNSSNEYISHSDPVGILSGWMFDASIVLEYFLKDIIYYPFTCLGILMPCK